MLQELFFLLTHGIYVYDIVYDLRFCVSRKNKMEFKKKKKKTLPLIGLS